MQDYKAKVLLLEGGGRDTNPLIKIPAGSFKLVFTDKKAINNVQSEPQRQLGGRVLNVAQGTVLGGGSSVNAMFYVRGTPADYDRWGELTDNEYGWNWEGMLAYFRAQEANIKFNNKHHGFDGPMKVSDPTFVVDSSHRFIQAGQALGLPFREDFNGEEKIGVGYCQATMHKGSRWSAVDGFIRPLQASTLLTVRTDAAATRVVFESKRAVGVEYVVGGRTETARARCEVLMAAGALQSPKLLMLSGIGPAAQLREHGIKIEVDLPGVGQNLRDHCMTGVAAWSKDTQGYFGEDKGWRMLRNGALHKFLRAGPATSNGGEAQAFVTLGDTAEPDIQIYNVGIMWPGAGVAPTDHGVTLLANLVRPYSIGNLKLKSANPTDNPIINPNFLSDKRDLDTMVKAVRYLRMIMRTRPYADIVKNEVMPGPQVETDAQIADFCKRTVETDYHPMGTCAMGGDGNAMAVVAPDLTVRGVRGLRVIDASVMPDIIGGNTNATVMAIAWRGVDIMMDRIGRQANDPASATAEMERVRAQASAHP